jgi:internalin A
MPVRVYDISKKLGVENRLVLLVAKELGIIAARVASSSLDKITAEYLEVSFHFVLGRIIEQRIREALNSGAEELDLGGLELTELPESLIQLTLLQRLLLHRNKLTEVPSWLGQMTWLKGLGLDVNQLRDLPKSLRQLSQLEHLNLHGNQIISLPEAVCQMIRLEVLHLGVNRLKTLPDSIGDLARLRALYLDNNQLNLLPDSIRKLKRLKLLDLRGNDALGIPPELLGPSYDDVVREELPAKPADILDYYFRTRGGKRPLNEVKLILLGRGGVGKTCLIKRLLYNTFDEHESETSGIEIQQWEVQVTSGDNVRLHVWDFGGQEILHATHQFFLTERTLYLLVLSGREGKASEDAEYWLQLIRSFGGDSKVIIVLNKSVGHPFDVNRGFLLEKYPFVADFVRTDCEDGTGLAELKELVLKHIDVMEHRKADFPKDWFAIKERLAEMTKRNENYVTWEQYQEICREAGEKDSGAQKKLSWYLNLLGVALNYCDDPRLKDTHVLNPRWVTEGIYPLLRAGQKDKREGVLELKDLAATLEAKKYPTDKHEFLVGLMQKFQLCFPLPELRGKPRQWLVPELLGENQPDIKALLDGPGLGFRYQYEVLPEGLLPRFIVQTHSHSEANPQWRWRTGVVLEWNGCRAVVRADYRERRVDIYVTGLPKRRRELLAVIREKFEEQHCNLKGITVDERVVIPNKRDASGKDVTVSYRDLLQREQDGEEEYRPERARQKVTVADLLDGVESAESRTKRREKEQQVIGGDTLIFNAPTTVRTGDKTMEKTTHISVQTNYGQVGEVLNSCTNIINQQPDGTAKELLEKLCAGVDLIIKALPPENTELKRETADNLKLLVDAATAEKPKRKWYSVSADGLIEASKFAKEFTGNIAGTIGQLGKVLWPDYELSETQED